MIQVDAIEPHPANPRRSDYDLERLTPSLERLGLLHPLLVRPSKKNAQRYQLVAGERRWRAAKRAGTSTVACMVRELDDAEALECMLAENTQRKALSVLETAELLQLLCEPKPHGGGLTQREAGELVGGRGQAAVANLIRLLKLPEAWKQKLRNGTLDQGRARLLLPHLDEPGFLELVAHDMEAQPALWETYAAFERSLLLLHDDKQVSGHVARAAARAPRASRHDKRPAAAAASPATNEHGTAADCAGRNGAAVTNVSAEMTPTVRLPEAVTASDVGQLCSLVRRMNAEQLRRIETAIAQRKAELAARPGPRRPGGSAA